jgi:hypothetical protein
MNDDIETIDLANDMTSGVMNAEDSEAEQSAVAQQGDWKVETLTIADCGPLYEKLKPRLASGDTVVLNISCCEEIDTAGLQFLAAIQNDPEVSLRIRWSKPSELVSMRASRLGLTSWIEAGAVEV